MFSKVEELTGICLIAIAIAYWSVWEAGLLVGGLAILFLGSVTDDQAVGMALKRGVAWIRYAWWRQVAKESGLEVPSPHPPIRVDPEAQARAERLANSRRERSKLHDRTAALSRHEYDEAEAEDWDRVG